jgi:acetyl-CoA acetyltransferase
MSVHILGMATHPPARAVTGKRLEEMVFDTARAALDDAGVKQADIDHVTIAACDELDGRAISSMLLAMPAGAYLRDETKCTDSGLTGLCLGAMRVASGIFDLGLVVSWNKTSEAPVENVMSMRAEPFYTRPIGLNRTVTDALFAGAVANRYGLTPRAADDAALDCYARAARNPFGIGVSVPSPGEIEASGFMASPLRALHQAPITDGAVAIVIASEKWLRGAKRESRARIGGLGWRSEHYDLGEERLAGLGGFRGAVGDALRGAGDLSIGDIDVIELDAQTSYHHLAFEAALGLSGDARVSPGGGAFARNPYFCTGLANAVDAIRQMEGEAGPIQRPDVMRAMAHGCHGFAQQGNVAIIFEGPDLGH